MAGPFPGTVQVAKWFEEVFNAVAPGGIFGKVVLIPASGGDGICALYGVLNGNQLPPVKMDRNNEIAVYYNEAAYRQITDALRAGKRAEIRYDGTPGSGYFRAYSD